MSYHLMWVELTFTPTTSTSATSFLAYRQPHIILERKSVQTCFCEKSSRFTFSKEKG